jgi:tripartite-type tricarboxylate transporter receptor subunit TctC
MMRRRSLLAASLAAPSLAHAQAPYPNRPIRVIVPFAAGGGTDVAARIWAARMSAAAPAGTSAPRPRCAARPTATPSC